MIKYSKENGTKAVFVKKLNCQLQCQIDWREKEDVKNCCMPLFHVVTDLGHADLRMRLKGQSHEIFCTRFFSSISSFWSHGPFWFFLPYGW